MNTYKSPPGEGNGHVPGGPDKYSTFFKVVSACATVCVVALAIGIVFYAIVNK